MRIFKCMSVEEAKALYNELNRSKCGSNFVRMCMVDLLWHTNNFQHDYGVVKCQK